MAEQVPLTPDDRLLAVTTIGFDIAALELYLPLLGGASIVIAPRETVQDAQALARTIGASRATVMQATPTLWQTLHAPTAASTLPDLKGLAMLTGGEALPGELARTLAAAWPHAHQSVRPDRDHDLVAPSWRSMAMSSATMPKPADRSSDLEHAGLCSGRWS